MAFYLVFIRGLGATLAGQDMRLGLPIAKLFNAFYFFKFQAVAVK